MTMIFAIIPIVSFMGPPIAGKCVKLKLQNSFAINLFNEFICRLKDDFKLLFDNCF